MLSLSLICLWVGGVLMGVGGTMLWMGYHGEDAYDFGEVLLCLRASKHCLTHDVSDTAKAFELRHIEALIKELEGR